MKREVTRSETSFDARQETSATPPEAMAFLWSRMSLLNETWDFLKAIMIWPDVSIAIDSSGLCLALKGVRLGHLRWDGRIDLPFEPEVADQLIAEEMADRDPENPHSHRVVFDLRTPPDVARAVSLFRLAYLIADPEGQRPCN